MRTVIPKNAVLVPDHARLAFTGILYSVYQWPQELYNGGVATFEMLKRADTVKVIAIDGENIIVLEQEQPNQGMFYDIPGGIHDHDDEDEFAAVKRELLEETGMQFRDWKLVTTVQPNRKIEQFVYIFIATTLVSTSEQRLDAGEKIRVMSITFEEAKNLLSSQKGRFLPGEIENASNVKDILSLPEYN